MQLRTLIRWINKNYPEVLIIRRGSNPDKRVLRLPKDGRVTIDFSCQPKGHGSILSNTDRKYVYNNYEKVIILFDYVNIRKNIWTLLHELGHHTSVQLKDNIIQNEINAWEDAFVIICYENGLLPAMLTCTWVAGVKVVRDLTIPDCEYECV